MSNIITKNINSFMFIELRDYMRTMLEESMRLATDISWYEDCSIEDYFHAWAEIWDEEHNCDAGEGIDTIAHKFVLNDDTRAVFEKAFTEAREIAYTTVINEITEDEPF